MNKILSESAAPFAGNMVGNEDALKTSTSQRFIQTFHKISTTGFNGENCAKLKKER